MVRSGLSATLLSIALPVALATFVSVVQWTSAQSNPETSGLPPLGKTDYPLGQLNLFVALNGDDANPGTAEQPFRSISKALEEAPDGSTVVLRGGVYRNQSATVWKRLTIQPFPGEQVWLKGSQVETRWTRTSSGWRTTDYKSNFCRDCYHPANIDKSNPAAGLPEQVFIDGLPLRQVTSRKEITKDSFYTDPANGLIEIGANPANRLVEISVQGNALTIVRGGEGSVVRGIGFAHYSPVATPGLGSTVKIDASDVTFEKNTITRSAVKGIEVFGARVNIHENRFIYNGMMGLGAWKADGLQISGNEFIGNNTEGFAVTGPVSEAAGAKITASRNITVADNLFHGNRANGLWFDLNVAHANVSANTFSGNARHGLFFELSAHGVITSNLSTRNAGSGIAIADADTVTIRDNRIEDNDIGLSVQDDDRTNTDPVQLELGHSWIARNIQFTDNSLSYSKGNAGHAFVWARDFNDKRSAAEMFQSFARNTFPAPKADRPEQPFVWWSHGQKSVFQSLEEFRSAVPGLFQER